MARIRMLPGSSPESIIQNFQRIENATEAIYDVDRARQNITGILVITTRLARVDEVVASLSAVPVAGACFVIAYPHSLIGGAPNNIVVAVYTNALAQSVLATAVTWIATGEMVMG